MSFGYRTMGLVLKLIFGSIAVGSLVGLILPFVQELFILYEVLDDVSYTHLTLPTICSV